MHPSIISTKLIVQKFSLGLRLLCRSRNRFSNFSAPTKTSESESKEDKVPRVSRVGFRVRHHAAAATTHRIRCFIGSSSYSYFPLRNLHIPFEHGDSCIESSSMIDIFGMLSFCASTSGALFASRLFALIRRSFIFFSCDPQALWKTCSPRFVPEPQQFLPITWFCCQY